MRVARRVYPSEHITVWLPVLGQRSWPDAATVVNYLGPADSQAISWTVGCVVFGAVFFGSYGVRRFLKTVVDGLVHHYNVYKSGHGLFGNPMPGEWTPQGMHANLPLVNVTPAGQVVHAGGRIAPSAAVSIMRLRRRARWVRALESALGGRNGVVGQMIRGRWTPDLPSPHHPDVQNYLLASIEDGAKLLGGGVEEVGVERHESDGVYFVIETLAGVEIVFPNLLAKLRQYALYRERDDAVLGSLRTRAVDWCRGVKLMPHVADLAVASAVSLAMVPSTHERSTLSRVQSAKRIPWQSLLPH